VESVQGGQDAVSAIVASTAEDGVYHFGELLDLDAVSKLAGGPNQAHLTLLKIFAYGTLNDYASSDASSISLSSEQRLKLQRLTLVSLCGNNRVVNYGELMKALAVSNVRDLEDLVIDAMYEGLVQGKLCQLEQTFEVTSAVGRDVRDEDIDTMLVALGAWNEKSKSLLGTIHDNVQTANTVGKETTAAAEELEKRKEDVKASVTESQLLGGDKGGSSGGLMGSMFSGGGAFMSGRPTKTKGRR